MSIAERAKEVCELELRSRLEATHCGQFVAIEPVSKAFFPGATFIEAALAAKNAFPDRKAFAQCLGGTQCLGAVLGCMAPAGRLATRVRGPAFGRALRCC